MYFFCAADQEQLDKEINNLRGELKTKFNHLNEIQGMQLFQNKKTKKEKLKQTFLIKRFTGCVAEGET